MRVVLDTNVIVSSYLNASGNPGKIRDALRNEQFDLIISDELLDEYTRALSYPRVASRHHMTGEEIATQVQSLRQIATVVALSEIPNLIPDDPDDNMVMATAVAGDAEYVVTGDDDLHRLGSYQGIRVLSPATFCTLLTQ